MQVKLARHFFVRWFIFIPATTGWFRRYLKMLAGATRVYLSLCI